MSNKLQIRLNFYDRPFNTLPIPNYDGIYRMAGEASSAASPSPPPLYTTDKRLWNNIISDLDNDILLLYHVDRYTVAELSNVRDTVTYYIVDIINRITYDTGFPWLPSEWKSWLIYFPRLLIHTIYLPLEFDDATVMEKIMKYLMYATTAATYNNNNNNNTTPGPIISTGQNALISFFNYYCLHVYLNTENIDTSSLNLTELKRLFNPKYKRFFDDDTTPVVILADEHVFVSPIQQKIDTNTSNGIYEDGTVLCNNILVNVSEIIEICTYKSIYTLLPFGDNVNVKPYEMCLKKIFHPNIEQTLVPLFCTYNEYLRESKCISVHRLISKEFPNIKHSDNYGVDIVPLAGCVYIKSQKSFFTLRVQSEHFGAFATTASGLEGIYWPLWIMSRSIQNNNDNNNNAIITSDNIINKPGVIVDYNEIINPINETNTIFKVNGCGKSFICKLNFDKTGRWTECIDNVVNTKSGVIWYQNYVLTTPYYDVLTDDDVKEARGLNVVELGICVSHVDRHMHSKIHYKIKNQFNVPQRFTFKDPTSKNKYLALDRWGRAITTTHSYIIIPANTETNITIYQTDDIVLRHTDFILSTINNSIVVILTKQLQMFSFLHVVDYLYTCKCSKLESVKDTDSIDPLLTSSASSSDTVNPLNAIAIDFLVANFPNTKHAINRNHTLYIRSSDYNYYAFVKCPHNNDDVQHSSSQSKYSPYLYILFFGICALIIVILIVLFQKWRGVSILKLPSIPETSNVQPPPPQQQQQTG